MTLQSARPRSREIRQLAERLRRGTASGLRGSNTDAGAIVASQARQAGRYHLATNMARPRHRLVESSVATPTCAIPGTRKLTCQQAPGDISKRAIRGTLPPSRALAALAASLAHRTPQSRRIGSPAARIQPPGDPEPVSVLPLSFLQDDSDHLRFPEARAWTAHH